MGADDGNEGREASECVEHLFVETGLDLRADGAVIEKACERCGAPAMTTPSELRGA